MISSFRQLKQRPWRVINNYLMFLLNRDFQLEQKHSEHWTLYFKVKYLELCTNLLLFLVDLNPQWNTRICGTLEKF